MIRYSLITLLALFTLAVQGQPPKPLYSKTVYFEFNKWDIRAEDNKTLSAVLRAIKAQKQPYYIEIIGHTDNVDNSRYNYQLGMKRAQTVAAYLTKRGADSTKMRLYSKGEDQAAAQEKTPDTLRLKDRKVVILLFKDNASAVAELKSTEIKPDTSPIHFVAHMVDDATGEPIKGQLLFFMADATGNQKLQNTYLGTDSLVTAVNRSKIYQIAYSAKGYRTQSIRYIFVDTATIQNNIYRVTVRLKKLKIKRKESFEKIYFYGNQARFLPSSGPELQRLLVIAKQPDVAAIEIVGHVNYPYHFNQNDSFYIRFNYELSYNRAWSVYNYLVENGVKKEVITFKGVSNTEMKYPNASTESEMQQNRRVEVLVLEE